MMDMVCASNGEKILKLIVAVRNNQELLYKAISFFSFFIDDHPTLVGKLLSDIAPQLDQSRTVPLLITKGEVALAHHFVTS